MIAKEKQDLELLKLKKDFEMELAEQKDINIEATKEILKLKSQTTALQQQLTNHEEKEKEYKTDIIVLQVKNDKIKEALLVLNKENFLMKSL